jgi:hypothetical protein
MRSQTRTSRKQKQPKVGASAHPLEGDPGADLNVARIQLRRGLAETGAGEVRVDASQVHAVEEIVELKA